MTVEGGEGKRLGLYKRDARGDIVGDLERTERGEDGGLEEGGSERSDIDDIEEVSMSMAMVPVGFYSIRLFERIMEKKRERKNEGYQIVFRQASTS